MYLHIVPQLFHLMANKCVLKSIIIPELDLKITADKLLTDKPYPNQEIWFGMLKGRKAIKGILLKTDKNLKCFTVDYRWHIKKMGIIKHRITTHIKDNEFDMISHDIALNETFGQWESRRHSTYDDVIPAINQPQMESFLLSPGKRDAQDTWRVYECGYFLESREETILMHTVQSERLNTDLSWFCRLPSIEQAIHI